jgi:hypothetical protein
MAPKKLMAKRKMLSVYCDETQYQWLRDNHKNISEFFRDAVIRAMQEKVE